MFTASFPVFQTYLLPVLPFRRRHSSSASTSSTLSNPTSPVTSPTRPEPISEEPFLSGSGSSISCSRCHAELALTSQIISKGFTGRHGRAYLVAPSPTADAPAPAADLPNTYTQKPVPRHLVTGLHTVSDVNCAVCSSVLGWKYVNAEEEAQRYKVGKVILESRRTTVGSLWEADEVRVAATTAEDGEVLFDSQDEDECEELFAGVWTPQNAKKRRIRRVGRG